MSMMEAVLGNVRVAVSEAAGAPNGFGRLNRGASTNTERGSRAGVIMARSELLERFLLPRASVDDRLAEGKHLRNRVPREAHAAYKPSPQRRNPVDILLEQAKSRLHQLVPIRHARMLESP